MIQNSRVLEDTFVPREVEHRNDEMNALTSALAPIAEGRSALPTFLVGPSGAGKTCLAHVALDRLREAAPSIAFQYVSCWQDYSRFRALARIAETVAPEAVNRRNATTGSLLDHLREHDGSEVVVVLDEVDQLHDTDVLFDLYQTRGVSIVLIVNRAADLFARVDERIVSRLRSSTRVRLDKYGVEELVAILRERVRLGLRPGVIDRDRLATIADAAAGDARVAINILRCGAEKATNAGADEVGQSVIEQAVADAREDVQRKQIDELSPHQQAVYAIVRNRERIEASALHEAYRERVDEPRSERTVRNYLEKLLHYDLIKADGDGRGRSYQAVE